MPAVFLRELQPSSFRGTHGCAYAVVQDNNSKSARNVLRGVHYQIRHPQGKPVRIVADEIFDNAVDIRKGSTRFGHWTGVNPSIDNKRQIWIPPGFVHDLSFLSLASTDIA